MNNGKIIKILDNHNVLVSLGEEDGIKSWSLLEVYTLGPEIKDLDGKSYGNFDIIKATLKPKNIYPKMTLCTNNELKDTATANLLAGIPVNYGYEDRKPLKVLESEISDEINLSEAMKIRLGDLVRVVSWT